MTPQEELKQIKASLQLAADTKARQRQEADRTAVFSQLGKYLSAALKPLQDAVMEMKKSTQAHEHMASRMSSMEMPEPVVNVDLSSLDIPAPQVTVKPIVNIPDIKMPSEMDIKGWVSLQGYDRGLLTNPLPVQLRDASGNPVKLFENLTTLIGGGGGGFRHVIVDQMPAISVTAAGASSVSLVNADGTYYNSDNPLPISGSFTASGLQASGAIDSVNLTQVGGNGVVVGTGYQDNALRVVHATDAIASVNIVGNIATLDVRQVSGAINSVSIVSNIAALDVKQVSGSADSVNLSSVNGSTVVVGTGYQDNALRVVHATDAIASVNIVSSTVFSVDSRGNALSMQTNPAPTADTVLVTLKADDLGRQIVRPVQARDLIATAYVSLATGTETTLITGIAATYLDCIMVVGSNNSDAAVSVDIRAVTAGNILHTLRIPANGTAGWAPTVPWPQDATGNNWTVDGPDETGRTLTFSALFSKEV